MAFGVDGFERCGVAQRFMQSPIHLKMNNRRLMCVVLVSFLAWLHAAEA